uniref:Uncharacterized protein n=1 Tax=Nothoprocta perdicaria TaxID=30464 RepID=A0A8C6ZRI1_NOTPE
MKRLFGFGRKRKGPPGGASPPCNPGAYELREKELGKLHRAAASGDVAQVRQALRKHGLDERDKAKRTPLHLACANGHSEVVSYLVENKCKLNLCDSDGRTPLMKVRDIGNLIVGKTFPLFLCCLQAVQGQQEECVAVLLAHGADPDLADAAGNTALHLAALAPNTSLAGQLLEHHALIDVRNEVCFENYSGYFIKMLLNTWQMVRTSQVQEKLLQEARKACPCLARLARPELLTLCWEHLLWTEEVGGLTVEELRRKISPAFSSGGLCC